MWSTSLMFNISFNLAIILNVHRRGKTITIKNYNKAVFFSTRVIQMVRIIYMIQSLKIGNKIEAVMHFKWLGK